MGQVRMFRDRVVSMEQTQEIGEKHIDLLAALATEALPGYTLAEHGLEHEQDLYVLTFANADTGEARRVAFTRMVLSDADRIPAIVADAAAPVRARIVDLIRSESAQPADSRHDPLAPDGRRAGRGGRDRGRVEEEARGRARGEKGRGRAPAARAPARQAAGRGAAAGPAGAREAPARRAGRREGSSGGGAAARRGRRQAPAAARPRRFGAGRRARRLRAAGGAGPGAAASGAA